LAKWKICGESTFGRKSIDRPGARVLHAAI
jgi:hypothetical protein